MPVPDYNYTRPRAPIAAMHKGPGPAYYLPSLTGHSCHDPRSVYNRGPAYQFGIVTKSPNSECSPGPVHLPDAKFLRSGKEGGRSYTIYPRLNELQRFSAPAPGTYAPGDVSLTKTKYPAYSLSGPYQPIKGSTTPAPNVYKTPSTLGRSIEGDKRQAPAYSVYGRSKSGFAEDFRKTPGPGTYSLVETNKYMKKYPQYSLLSRNFMPGDPTVKPGPGTYNNEDVTCDRKSSPRHTFGIRHSEYVAPLIVDVD